MSNGWACRLPPDIVARIDAIRDSHNKTRPPDGRGDMSRASFVKDAVLALLAKKEATHREPEPGEVRVRK